MRQSSDIPPIITPLTTLGKLVMIDLTRVESFTAHVPID